MSSWELKSAEEYHEQAPDTFEIPELAYRANLEVGQYAKCIFHFPKEDSTERMWVVVIKVTKTGYLGKLANKPVTSSALVKGDEIEFGPANICSIYAGN